MATPVIMPRQGQSVESCIIGKWHKKPGDAVAVGDNLFTYETDKATFDETASVAGTLLAVFFQEGDDVPCLTNVCVIGALGENADAFAPGGAPAASAQPAAAPASVASAPVAAEPAPAVAPVQPAVAASGAVSPRAKHLAERTGADLRQAQGSGPAGRVIERDVLALVAEGRMATPAAGEHAAGIVGTALGGRVGLADAEATQTAPAATPTAPARPADAAE